MYDVYQRTRSSHGYLEPLVSGRDLGRCFSTDSLILKQMPGIGYDLHIPDIPVNALRKKASPIPSPVLRAGACSREAI